MSVFVPKGAWRKPIGFVASQKSVEEWWEKNKDKRWNPTMGLHAADLEPTDEQLRDVERRIAPSFRDSINNSFKHLPKDQEQFVNQCEKSLDKCNDQGYVATREVVEVSVTSNGRKNTDTVVPSSNRLAVCVADGDGNSTVVPESVTSSVHESRAESLDNAGSIPSLC